jgi:hypothetical protein
MTRSALIASLLALVQLLAPLAARAQDPAPAPEVCLPLPAHQAILADLRELRGDGSPQSTGLRGRVRLLDEKLELQADQLRDLALAKDLAVQAKDAIEGSLEAAVRGKREAEESRDAWYRSPVLWFSLGVVGSLAIAIAVDKIQE